VADYKVGECIADYLAMRPEANAADVRVSIEFDMARDLAGTLPHGHK
jgi:hypothetical protein